MRDRISRPRFSMRTILLVIALIVIYVVSLRDTETSLVKVIEGIPNMLDFVGRMFPPDTAVLSMTIHRLVETVQIAIVGTTLGVIGALAICFLAARNFTPHRIVCYVSRIGLNAARGVSEIVYALLFVAMVGLGAFPGVLALAVHTTGALGKYFSEAIENMEQDAIDAVRATGANGMQVVSQGILPELLPGFVSYSLYYFEHNIRAATVLGLVGAGGIGVELLTSLKLFKYDEVLTMLISMLILITAIDQLSAALRSRISD